MGALWFFCRRNVGLDFKSRSLVENHNFTLYSLAVRRDPGHSHRPGLRAADEGGNSRAHQVHAGHAMLVLMHREAEVYNALVRSFPRGLVASLFRFRPCGCTANPVREPGVPAGADVAAGRKSFPAVAFPAVASCRSTGAACYTARG